jgi:NAD(P)-dependent dehydrogenase (short-subunit alcohol dehydrogenase family)
MRVGRSRPGASRYWLIGITESTVQFMTSQLHGQNALITGATSGIGEAIARRFAAEGANVILSGRSEDRAQVIISDLQTEGQLAAFVPVDLSASPATLRQFASQAERAAGGHIDILVLNAGIYPVGPTESVSDEDLDALLAVNIRSPHVLVGALAPAMADRGHGTVIVISSWMALVGTPGSAIYTATKAADEQLARAWAAEYGPRGVRVNALAPGVTLTPGNAAYREVLDAMTANTPKGDVVTPEQIADGAAFLASEQAAALHGSTLLMDGGMTTTRLS